MEKRTPLLAEGNPYLNDRLTNTLEDAKAKLTVVRRDITSEKRKGTTKIIIGNGRNEGNDEFANIRM